MLAACYARVLKATRDLPYQGCRHISRCRSWRPSMGGTILQSARRASRAVATEAEITSRFQWERRHVGDVSDSHHGVQGYVAGQSGLRHHAARQRGTVFKTRANPPRNRLLRHHAARQRGAVFTVIDAVIGTRSSREHGPTLASSVVAEDVAARGAISGSEHGSTLTSSVVAGIREAISVAVATTAELPSRPSEQPPRRPLAFRRERRTEYSCRVVRPRR